MLNLTRQQRAAILRAAKVAETVHIPVGRPRDVVSAYTYGPSGECWFSGMGHIPNHECNVACRLIEMQLRRGEARPMFEVVGSLVIDTTEEV